MKGLATLPPGLHRRIIEKQKRFIELKLSPDAAQDLEERMRVEFVYNSNSIEGVTLSRGETELALRGITVRGRSIGDVMAAQNHPKGMQLVKDLALGKKKLSQKNILEIHRAIMSGIISSAGEYRRGEVRIAGSSFTPPPAYTIPESMKELVEFVNENPDELRSIELATHAHYHLAWIHPFDDGNGRVARLIMNMILMANRYPFAIIKNVDRKKYIDTLEEVSQTGEFQPFLTFIARCVEQTLDVYLATGGRAKEKLKSLSILAKKTPYSAEYLSLQARKGVLDAVKVGRVWMSTRKTIETYMKDHGRKSP